MAMKPRTVRVTVEMHNAIPATQLQTLFEHALYAYEHNQETGFRVFDFGRTQRVHVDPAPRGKAQK